MGEILAWLTHPSPSSSETWISCYSLLHPGVGELGKPGAQYNFGFDSVVPCCDSSLNQPYPSTLPRMSNCFQVKVCTWNRQTKQVVSLSVGLLPNLSHGRRELCYILIFFWEGRRCWLLRDFDVISETHWPGQLNTICLFTYVFNGNKLKTFPWMAHCYKKKFRNV